jgi:hypothetical protein
MVTQIGATRFCVTCVTISLVTEGYNDGMLGLGRVKVYIAGIKAHDEKSKSYKARNNDILMPS